MKVFFSDIDNTLIYSYRHDIGQQKQCVEIYQGREISFMTNKSYQALHKICESYTFVPTTTRTIEQYKRIDFGIEVPEYALVCNGGILLKHGISDRAWYEESLKQIEGAEDSLDKAAYHLERDEHISFEIRNIHNLFLFTKSDDVNATVTTLMSELDTEQVDILSNGSKVYVVPKELNKGNALLRLKKKLGAKISIAAGDSEFDVPMLAAADMAMAPDGLRDKIRQAHNVTFVPEHMLFSEEVLNNLEKLAENS